MAKPVLHQFSEGVSPGDAVSDQTFLLRRWLRAFGFASEIYAENVPPALAGEVLPAADYRPSPQERCLIHHHAVGSHIAERLLTVDRPQILIYHNITPPEFFAALNPNLAVQLRKGREQLAAMQPRTCLALGDSRYNERELQALGYERTGVLPIVLDEAQYDLPLNPDLVAAHETAAPLLLFVGRLAPNKRQEDLLKLLYYLRRIEPQAHLALVGGAQDTQYVSWLNELARALGLAEAVTFTGHVSQQDMVTYFKTADLYVSMSEHEGFGKPLIESMYLELPVLAYGSTAVPDTLGDAGVLFAEKRFEALAELVSLLHHDTALRGRLLARQRERVQAFLAPQVRRLWRRYLADLGVLPDA